MVSISLGASEGPSINDVLRAVANDIEPSHGGSVRAFNLMMSLGGAKDKPRVVMGVDEIVIDTKSVWGIFPRQRVTEKYPILRADYFPTNLIGPGYLTIHLQLPEVEPIARQHFEEFAREREIDQFEVDIELYRGGASPRKIKHYFL